MSDFDIFEICDRFISPVDYQYYHQLLENRTIVFNKEVDESIVESVCLPLKDFEDDDSQEPVTLILQSVGGSMSDGLALINIIDNYTKPLNIIVYGYAYSMSFAILCAGSKNPNVTRKCYAFSTALWHSGSTMLSGDTNVVNDIQDFNRKMDDTLKEYIIENTLIPRELYEKKERYQFYFNAVELLRYGIIDEIIGEAKIPAICKQCLIKNNCENRIDYAFERVSQLECEEFEPDVN